MKDQAQDILLRVLAQHQDSALSDRLRCFGLLKDFGGNEHPEVEVLADCVQHQIAQRLAERAGRTVDEAFIESMASDFRARSAYAAGECRWAVEAWAQGLDIKIKPGPQAQAPRKSSPPRIPESGRQGPPPVPELPKPLLPPAAPDVIEVAFDCQQRDQNALQEFWVSLSGKADRERRVLHIVTGCFGMIAGAVVGSSWWEMTLTFVIGWAALFWGVRGLLLLGERFAKVVNHRSVDEDVVIDRRTVKMTADGIFESNRLGSDHRPWHAITTVEVTSDHLFLMGSSKSYIVPLRAFSKDLKKGLDFVDFAKAHFEAAQAKRKTQTSKRLGKPRRKARARAK